MPPTSLATSAVQEAVRAVLAGEPTPASVASVSDDDFVAEARSQRVIEVLIGTGLRASVDERLCESADAQRKAVLRQVRQMVELADALTGLRWLSFKGPLLAIQTTGDFVARGPGDLDILLSRDDVAEAHRRIVGAGWTPYGAWPRPTGSWAWRHLLRSSCELPLGGPHSIVDLHWALASTLGVLPTFEQAWDRRVEVNLAHRSWDTLCLADALRHSCAHASTDYWTSLRSLVDVHRLASEEAVWGELQGGLGRTELTTLRVVQDRIGLPSAVPMSVLADVAAVPQRRLAALSEWGALRMQDGAPGSWTTHSLVTHLRESTSLGEAGRAISAAVLPAHALAGVHSAHAAVAVPQALGQRVSRVARRLRQRFARARSAR